MPIDGFDVAVIGGGIAGVSAACFTAPDRSVLLLEQERELAYHTTSRSAAMYLEDEGRPVFHRLSMASREFFEADHPELDAPLVDPLPVLKVGTAENHDEFAEAAATQVTGKIRLVDEIELRELCPVLRPGVATVGLYEATAASVDVMALHQLFLRRARAAGAEVRRSARVTGIERRDGRWRLATATREVWADVVVDAAGAWGDEIARMAGVQPVGLTPMRRTAFTSPVDTDPTGWPFVYAPSSRLHCYFKPEAGNQLLCSLADEGASDPCDARPEEVDVAQAIDHINELTTLGLRSVGRAWAGLRTFAPDRDPVFGWDDRVDGFLWMVGQGGTGIVSAPAAGEIAAGLIAGRPLPPSVTDLGLTESQLAPRRRP
ncbi:MAG: NAD(P)/FAD-dependent oxidoreductase [Ilumatobacteraceae bacterium]